MSEPKQGPAPSSPQQQRQLHAERELVIARLSEHFSQGELELDDFDRRLDDVHRSTSSSEIQRCTHGLPQTTSASLPLTPAATALIPAEQAPFRKKVLAIFGSSQRKGTWTVPRRLSVAAVFGNIELDFSEARLPAGVIELEVRAAFGNVEILVPPHLAVETEGTGVFGNFEHVERAPAVPDLDAPMLHIKGVSVFGNIQVSTRLPKQDKSRRG